MDGSSTDPQMQLKIMIATILLKYEIKLPDGRVTRPKDFVWEGSVLPPLKEHLLFKPQTAIGGDMRAWRTV